jgi:hypothetical protein
MISGLITKLEDNDIENINLYYILRTKKGEDISYRISGIKIDSTVGEFFKHNVNEYLTNKLSNNDENIDYVPYEPDVSIERNIVLKIAKNEVDLVEEYLDKLSDVESIEDVKSIKQKNLWGYIVYFNDIDLYMFKKFSSTNVKLQSKGIMNVTIGDNILNSIDKDIITFDSKIDCLLYQDDFLIFHKQNFESVFDFFEKMYQIVEDNISLLSDNGYIKDTDKLYEVCKKDSRKIKKLKNILTSGVLDSIDKGKFSEINTEFDLGLEFDEDGNIIVTEEVEWKILGLLNDDNLKSYLTSLKYEVQSKIKK